MKLKAPPLHVAILLAMAAGAVLGRFLPQAVPFVAPLGQIFLRILKMLVIPLTFVSILDGVARAGSMERLSRIGFKTLVFYAATNALAVITSLLLVNWIRPGVGVTIFGHAPAIPAPSGQVWEIIPDNLVAAFARGDTIQIILAAVFFGSGLVVLTQKVPLLRQAVGEANELLLTVTGWVINLAPVGVFGLIAAMAGTFDMSVLAGVGKFAATIILGLLIHGGITLPLLFKIFSNRPLGRFVKNMEPALVSAFSTSSSSATLPITLECIEKEEKISRDIAGFVLPLGATVNMDGTAIYEAAACLFVAQALGVDLTFGQQILVFLTAMLAAVGAAAIPSAGLVTLAMVLTAVKLPLDGIGFLLAIDRPLDMSRTIVNVWGDMVACAVVEGKEKDTSSDRP